MRGDSCLPSLRRDLRLLPHLLLWRGWKGSRPLTLLPKHPQLSYCWCVGGKKTAKFEGITILRGSFFACNILIECQDRSLFSCQTAIRVKPKRSPRLVQRTYAKNRAVLRRSCVLTCTFYIDTRHTHTVYTVCLDPRAHGRACKIVVLLP